MCNPLWRRALEQADLSRSLPERQVPDVEPHEPVLRVVERLGHRADDAGAETLPIMNEAVATWAPRPGRLGPIFAEPTMTPSMTATTVRPGARSSQ